MSHSVCHYSPLRTPSCNGIDYRQRMMTEPAEQEPRLHILICYTTNWSVFRPAYNEQEQVITEILMHVACDTTNQCEPTPTIYPIQTWYLSLYVRSSSVSSAPIAIPGTLVIILQYTASPGCTLSTSSLRFS